MEAAGDFPQEDMTKSQARTRKKTSRTWAKLEVLRKQKHVYVNASFGAASLATTWQMPAFPHTTDTLIQQQGDISNVPAMFQMHRTRATRALQASLTSPACIVCWYHVSCAVPEKPSAVTRPSGHAHASDRRAKQTRFGGLLGISGTIEVLRGVLVFHTLLAGHVGFPYVHVFQSLHFGFSRVSRLLECAAFWR